MRVSERAINRLPLAFVCASILMLAAASYAFANPQGMENPVVMAETSFAGMDADKDGNVTPEEFFTVFPNMRETAFSAIDKNDDKIITLEEWKAFYVGHSQDTANHAKMMEAPAVEKTGQDKPAAGNDEPDLVMPAK